MSVDQERMKFLFLVILRPHHYTVYVNAPYCYRPSNVVCLLVRL